MRRITHTLVPCGRRPHNAASRSSCAFALDIFIQQLVNGLTLGSVYAIVALGYTMVYGIIRLINFAHGDIYAVGAFLGLSTYGLLALLHVPNAILTTLLALIVSMGCTGLLGMLLFRVARSNE